MCNNNSQFRIFIMLHKTSFEKLDIENKAFIRKENRFMTFYKPFNSQ